MSGKMNESVYKDLTDMGFEEAQCRQAAMCFSDAQSALDWIFAGGNPADLPAQGPPDWPMQGPSNVPTRTNTPHRVATPSQPSPTVSDFDGDVWSQYGTSRNNQRPAAPVGNVTFQPQGMSEEEAIQAAIEASQLSANAFSNPHDQIYDPPAAPRPEYPPPPGPPPVSQSSSRRSIDRRGTRSPTPGPPEIERRREGSIHAGPVIQSNNPFRQAMQPPSSLPDPAHEQQVEGNVVSVPATTSAKNVHFPPSVIPAQLASGSGGGSLPGSGLKRVDDTVEDDDGMRGMVLVPSNADESKGAETSATSRPARSSQNAVALHRGRSDSPPPTMDTYPLDSDEESAAIERAIKASLSTASTVKDAEDEENKVDRDVNVDAEMTDGDVQAAAEALVDWRQNEDEDDIIATRQPNAPLAIRSKMANSVWAAHVLQALMAIPAIRRAIEDRDPMDERLIGWQQDRDALDFLTQLVQAHNDTSREYTNVTLKLDHFNLTAGSTYLTSPTYEMIRTLLRVLEPEQFESSAVKPDSLEPAVIDVGLVETIEADETDVKPIDTPSGAREAATPVANLQLPSEPERSLLTSHVKALQDDERDPRDLCWIMTHDAQQSKTVSDTIAAFFEGHNKDSGFTRLSDVFCIAMKKADRKPGQSGGEVMVELEEAIFMDRFLVDNMDQVNTLQTEQQAVKAKILARQEEIAQLTKYKGREIEKMIDRRVCTIHHYESEYGPTGSEEAVRTIRTATISQLQAVKTTLASKRDELVASLRADETELASLWDKPELRRNKASRLRTWPSVVVLMTQRTLQYHLHAVCFNSGWTGMNAIRSYVKGSGDQWWRFRETIIEKTSFAELAVENWGLMFDQGPFFLVYTRAADNPPSRSKAEEPARPLASADVATVKVETADAVESTPGMVPTEDLLGLDVVATDAVAGVKKPEDTPVPLG